MVEKGVDQSGLSQTRFTDYHCVELETLLDGPSVPLVRKVCKTNKGSELLTWEGRLPWSCTISSDGHDDVGMCGASFDDIRYEGIR